MEECSVPGCSENDVLSYTCRECAGTYCSAHRDPVDHDCSGVAGETGQEATPAAADTGAENNTGNGRSADRLAYSGQTDDTTTTSSRRWTGWVFGTLRLLVLGALVVFLVLGFTPATMPDSVPENVADPIEQAADSGAEMVAEFTARAGAPAMEPMAAGSNETSTGDSGSQPTVEGEQSASSIDRAELEQLVHQEINDVRQDHELSKLAFDDDLREVARYHSKDMAQEEYFAHTAPDGETMSDRYDTFGYSCRVSTGDGRYATGGENIYMMQYTVQSYSEEEIAQKAVEGWMNSPGHRENILREYWQKEAIGVYVIESGGETRVYVTQNFC